MKVYFNKIEKYSWCKCIYISYSDKKLNLFLLNRIRQINLLQLNISHN